jgi:peptidoglycan/xylan/chitin deacetylase (PgdA/CDA1 family)
VFRHLLIGIAAVALAVPGVASVFTNVTNAPAAPPATGLSTAPALPAAMPTILPTASPSPGDTTPPVTTASGAGTRWRNTAATVRFSATDPDSGVAATVYRVGSGDWVIGTKVVVGVPKNHSNDGEHVISYYSVDNALNQETPKTVTVRIDTKPPQFAWRKVSPGIIRRIQPVTFRFAVTEQSGPVTLAYKVSDQYGYPAISQKGLQRSAGARSLRLVPRYKNHKGFVPGVYRLQMTLTDEAGNTTVSKRRSFRNYRPMNGGVWRRVSGAGRRVALTFDDGGAGPWQSMLTTLKRYKAHATFFPLGAYAAASRSLMRRTVREGHAIGSHGMSHTAMTRQSAGAVRSEWTRSIQPWWSATGYSPVPYCRPPYGDLNGTTRAASGSIGFYRIVLWDVDPQDWSEPGAGAIASRVLSHVRPGSIVVMHLRPQTAAALPAILRGLKARGYKAVSLPELFHAAGHR